MEPTLVDLEWVVRQDPRAVSWWRRLLRLIPEIGRLSLRQGEVAYAPSGDAPRFRADLNDPTGVHLALWPESHSTGWLSLTLSQHQVRWAARIALPWSAIPENTQPLKVEGPILPLDAFEALWAAIRHAEAARGNPLPEIKAGLYSPEARHLTLIGLNPRLVSNLSVRHHGPYPRPPSQDREELKRFARAQGPESYLACPFCLVGVKSRNILRHCDKLHYKAR